MDGGSLQLTSNSRLGEQLADRVCFQLRDLPSDLHRVPAGYRARLAGAASFEPAGGGNARQHVACDAGISVLHGVHVRPHQDGDIDVLRAVVAAFAALLAKLCAC